MPTSHRRSARWLPVAGLAALVAVAGPAQRLQPSPPPVPAKFDARAPRYFEANHGQAAGGVEFVARGRGYALLLKGGEATLVPGPPAPSRGLRLRFVGARPAARGVGVGALPGRIHYLRGRDPAQWQTNVPTFARVRYAGLYPSVDAVYYWQGDQLEYDLVVHPGGDVASIRLAVEGAGSPRLDAAGDLVLTLAGGELRLQRPLVYQDAGDRRARVDAAFTWEPCGGECGGAGVMLGFRIAGYDRSRTLVVDPVIAYSTFLGGANIDTGSGIAVDAAGNAYVAGTTDSTNFPAVNGLQPTLAGDQDVFVAKLNRSGSALVYATYLGGAGADSAAGIAVDAAGNAYVTGSTGSADFPVVGGIQSVLGGASDAFVAKLDANGSSLLYSTYLGGAAPDSGAGIAVDAAGSAYVTGTTESANFPVVAALQPSPGGGPDAFVAKLDAAGGALVYSTFLGGSGSDGGAGIAVDAAGQAHVTGSTQSGDFPLANALQASLRGPSDAFVAKLAPAGAPLLYSTFLGGTSGELGAGIALDATGHVYVTGTTSSGDFPTVNPAQAQFNQFSDPFVTKLTPTGSALVYSTYLAPASILQNDIPSSDSGFAIAVDAAGNAYVTGSGLRFTIGFLPSATVAGLSASGSTLLFSLSFTGSVPLLESDAGLGIAVTPGGTVHVAGFTGHENFGVVNALQPTSGGFVDAFVMRILTAPDLAVALNRDTFGPGDTMVLTGSLTPVDGTGLVDAYVVIRTPDGRFFSLQPGGGAVLGITPIARRVTPAAFAGEILRYTFAGTEDAGAYTWFAALTRIGTITLVGDVARADFTVTP